MAPKKFSDFEKTHKGFQVPKVSIKVGNSIIKPEEFPVLDLNVVMSAGFDMSSCEFTVAGIFDHKNSKFKKDAFTQFKPGKVVDVKIGYSTTTGVFKGYVNAVTFDFNGQNGPLITVQCLDAKGALVNNKTWENYGKQTIKAIVESILKKKCSKYATVQTVDTKYDSGDTSDSPEFKTDMDDYKYVVMFAQKTNNSFCVIYDKLYFCENLAAKSKVNVELSWGKGLISFNTEINLSDQIGAVHVYGKDHKTNKTFTAKADKLSGGGESAGDMASVVKNKIVVMQDQDVINQSQAQELAKHSLESYASGFVKCKGTTIGLPEIIPGDKIKITGMGNGVDGVFYLNRVTHRISEQGYITSFEGSSPKVNAKS